MKELWVEKYRPKTIDEYVFRDEQQRKQVQQWIKEKTIPHLLFSGNAGIGKTTLAKLLSNYLGYKLILETFENNPFLKDFYENLNKNALPLELFFLAERYELLKLNSASTEKKSIKIKLTNLYFQKKRII